MKKKIAIGAVACMISAIGGLAVLKIKKAKKF